jgi:hypothetical protein
MNDPDTKELVFAYTSLLPEVTLRPGLRTSVWAEGDVPACCMPCEFQHVTDGPARVEVRVLALDPAGRVSKDLVGRAFSFGHPGRIVGHGLLLAVLPKAE